MTPEDTPIIEGQFVEANQVPPASEPAPDATIASSLDELELFTLPEAGGVAWAEMYTPSGHKVNLTSRSRTPREALDGLMDVIAYGAKQYKLSGDRTMSPAPDYSRAVAPTAPPPSHPAPAAAQAVATAATPNEGDPGQPIFADRFEATVRPDGRIEVKFYQAGHRYPDVVAVRELENMLSLMRGSGRDYQAHHLSGGQSQELNCWIEWKYGKLNSKGGRYKDILSIHP